MSAFREATGARALAAAEVAAKEILAIAAKGEIVTLAVMRARLARLWIDGAQYGSDVMFEQAREIVERDR